MKNRLMAMCVLAAVMLAGCGSVEKADTSEEKSDKKSASQEKETADDTVREEPPVTIDEETEPETDDAENNDADEAETALMSFLEGNGTAQTSDLFNDEESDRYYCLDYGTYTYDELRQAVEETEGGRSSAKYALLDLNNDSHKELVLRFDAGANTSLINWIGIFHYTAQNGIILEDEYSDGYRTYSTLYNTGFLEIGGSDGAGMHGHSLYGFNDNCQREEIFYSGDLGSSFAPYMLYDIMDDNDEAYSIISQFTDSLIDSRMCVNEYKDADGVRFLATELSDDPTINESENALIDTFEKYGAVKVTEDEMLALTNTSGYGEEVEWVNFGEQLNESLSYNIKIYSDPNSDEYKALGDAEVLNTGSDTDMRFVCDVDGVTVKLQKVELESETMEFLPTEEIFSITTEADKVYQFNAFEGETMPYYRLTAESGEAISYWDVLPDMRDGDTTFTLVP